MSLSPEIRKIFEVTSLAHLNASSKDKGSEAPYHWHLARCAIRLGDSASNEEIFAALLHDVLEDTSITEEDLIDLNLQAVTVDAIKLCSNIYYKNITHRLWMTEISQSKNLIAKKVKLVDLADNHCFERMLGLDMHFNNERKKLQLQKNDIILNSDNNIYVEEKLSSFIFKKVDKSLKKKSNYGLWKRYVEDMDIILSNNKSNLNQFKDLNLESFCTFKDYSKIYEYIGKEEFLEYRNKQKVMGFRHPLSISLINDNAGNPYLVAVVDCVISHIYQKTLDKLIDHSQEYLNNQIKRDSGSHHITLLTSSEYGRLNKFNSQLLKELINSLGEQVDFNFYTIGSAKDTLKNNTAYYALCESGYIQNFRQKLGLSSKDLHCTIGFKEKDIFTVKKNLATRVCSFSLVWEQACDYFHTNKASLSQNNRFNL